MSRPIAPQIAENAQEIINGYQDGTSVLKLASRFGVSDNTIRNFLMKQGVYKRKMPPRNQKSVDERKKIIIELDGRGLKEKTIAKKTGLNITTVRRIIDAHNEPLIAQAKRDEALWAYLLGGTHKVEIRCRSVTTTS